MGSCATVEAEGNRHRTKGRSNSRRPSLASADTRDVTFADLSEAGTAAADSEPPRSSNYLAEPEAREQPSESATDAAIGSLNSPTAFMRHPDDPLFELVVDHVSNPGDSMQHHHPAGCTATPSEPFAVLLPSAPTSGSDVTVGPHSRQRSTGVESWLDEQLDSVGFHGCAKAGDSADNEPDNLVDATVGGCPTRTAGYNPHNLQAVLEAAAQMASRELQDATKRARRKLNHLVPRRIP